MQRVLETFGHVRHAPWSAWVVVAMSIGTAVYQYPTYHPVPPLIPYILGTGALIVGFAVGARWAFVVCILTAWIFPLETLLGVKAPLHGTTLTVMQCIAIGLLFHARDYYWTRTKKQAAEIS